RNEEKPPELSIGVEPGSVPMAAGAVSFSCVEAGFACGAGFANAVCGAETGFGGGTGAGVAFTCGAEFAAFADCCGCTVSLFSPSQLPILSNAPLFTGSALDPLDAVLVRGSLAGIGAGAAPTEDSFGADTVDCAGGAKTTSLSV